MKEENDNLGSMEDLLFQNEIDNNETSILSSSIQYNRNQLFRCSIYKKSSNIKYEKEKIMERIINEFIEINSILKRCFSMPHLNHINLKNKNIIILDEDEDEKEEAKKTHTMIIRSQSFSKKKEMNKIYHEENEKINQNIKFNATSKQIKCISDNLMLKKIILENFLNDKAEIIYHFCQQCFCFIKADIYFEKIFSCFKFYIKKNKY